MSRNSFMRIELCAYILHHLSHNKWIPFATISWLCCCCCCSFFSCNVYKFYGFFSCLSLCVCISFQFSFGTWTPETPTHTHMCTHWLTSCFAHKRFQWGLLFFFFLKTTLKIWMRALCAVFHFTRRAYVLRNTILFKTSDAKIISHTKHTPLHHFNLEQHQKISHKISNHLKWICCVFGIKNMNQILTLLYI